MSLSIFLTIAISSMIPITELRATIPIFIAEHPEIHIGYIFIAAVIGNIIPNFFLLWFLPRITKWLHNHVAPKINKTVLWLHDFFIRKNRLAYVYASVTILTASSLALLYNFEIHSIFWNVTVALGVPLWAYILFIITQKAYKTALEEKSIIHWIYDKIHKEHSEKFYKKGSIALVAIVGLPIPGTGSWTGSLLAFLFNIPYWKAMGLISLGVIISGAIVTAISTGIISGIGWI